MRPVGFILVLAIAAPGLGSAGCARSLKLERPDQYVLLTNLRVGRGGKITSINSWRLETVLPACTPVQIHKARGRQVRFTAHGAEYVYVMHRSSRLELFDHFERTFGRACTSPSTLGKEDQLGLQTAQPYVGMTRLGVLIAAGYPPDHGTPVLTGPTWTYWGRRGKVQVVFAGDRVTHVTGHPFEPAVVGAASVGARLVPVTRSSERPCGPRKQCPPGFACDVRADGSSSCLAVE